MEGIQNRCNGKLIDVLDTHAPFFGCTKKPKVVQGFGGLTQRGRSAVAVSSRQLRLKEALQNPASISTRKNF